MAHEDGPVLYVNRRIDITRAQDVRAGDELFANGGWQRVTAVDRRQTLSVLTLGTPEGVRWCWDERGPHPRVRGLRSVPVDRATLRNALAEVAGRPRAIYAYSDDGKEWQYLTHATPTYKGVNPQRGVEWTEDILRKRLCIEHVRFQRWLPPEGDSFVGG